MQQSTVFRTFAEVALALGYDAVGAAPGDPDADAEPERGAAETDLAALVAGLEAAGAALATALRQDERARERAADDLAEHDRLVAALGESERALERASTVRRDAEALATNAFADEARRDAGRVATDATTAEASLARLVRARRTALEAFAAAHDLARLLAERHRREAEEDARAARAARAERLAGALSRARQALAAGRWEEALEILAPVASENPDNPEVSSLRDIIARHALERKVAAAEDALRLARRERRHDPAAAVARLEALDVEGLPQPLAGHLFGCWAEGWARLCRLRGLADPLRYAPGRGRGAVLARDGAGPHVVVGAIGLGPTWPIGRPVADAVLRRARPLR